MPKRTDTKSILVIGSMRVPYVVLRPGSARSVMPLVTVEAKPGGPAVTERSATTLATIAQVAARSVAGQAVSLTSGAERTCGLHRSMSILLRISGRRQSIRAPASLLRISD